MHRRLDGARAIALAQPDDLVAREHDARDLRAQVERDKIGHARLAQVQRFHLGPDLIVFDHLERRQHDWVGIDVLSVLRPAAGDNAAQIILVPGVGDPTE